MHGHISKIKPFFILEKDTQDSCSLEIKKGSPIELPHE
jgi:hypothetical protein